MNIPRIIIILILVILFVVINLCKIENFIGDKKITIGFIIPITSNKRNYNDIQGIDFYKIFINSLKDKLNNKFNYEFYLGYDNIDYFYINNEANIINYFKKLNLNNSKIKLLKINNKKGKLGELWSILAKEAYKTCDYIYQIGDDIEIISDNWENIFIDQLKKNNNIGVVGPTDINNRKILTQSFVHKTHIDIFGEYFPKLIENWYIDDWITNVYKPNYSYQIKNIYVKNMGGKPRYSVNKNKKNYEKELRVGKNKLDKYLNNRNNDYIISMFLTGGLNEEAHNCIFTLKQVGMIDNLIVTCLDKKALNYISNLGVKTQFLNLNLKDKGEFGSRDFYKITTQKPKIISDLIKKYNKIVVYSDTDIVFLKNFYKEINNFKNDNNDMLLQDESEIFKKTGDYCTGFMFFKPNEKNIRFLDKVHKIMLQNVKNRPEKSTELADQGVFGKMLKTENIKFDTLDLYDFPNGKRYFDNVDTVYKTRIPKIVHNNFIIGLDNKINRFKKHNLWFIDFNKFKIIQKKYLDTKIKIPYNILSKHKVHLEDFVERFINHEKDTNTKLKLLLNNINDYDIIDAGAHIGDTGIFMAKYLKDINKNNVKIIMIEPDKNKVDFINYIININKLEKYTEVYNYAIGNKYEKGIIVKEGDNISNYLGGSGSWRIEKCKKNNCDIIINSIDNILGDRKIGLMHLDIEGFEYEALLGSKNILQKYKPKLIIEVIHSDKLKINRFLSKYNYQFKEKLQNDYFYE